MKEFAPKVHHVNYLGGGVLVEMLLRLPVCVVCEKPMINRQALKRFGMYDGSVWPTTEGLTLSAQMKAAGIVEDDGDMRDDGYVCRACNAAGKGGYTCVICKNLRSEADTEYSTGSPAEHMCRVCYETVPAKKWTQIMNVLDERHRHDFD